MNGSKTAIRHVIHLDGFTYERFGGIAPIDAKARKKWLKCQPAAHMSDDFKPQPFEQVIKVLKNMGHPEEARLLAIERQGFLVRRRLSRSQSRKRGRLRALPRYLWDSDARAVDRPRLQAAAHPCHHGGCRGDLRVLLQARRRERHLRARAMRRCLRKPPSTNAEAVLAAGRRAPRLSLPSRNTPSSTPGSIRSMCCFRSSTFTRRRTGRRCGRKSASRRRLRIRGSKLGHQCARADRGRLRLGRKPSGRCRFLRPRQDGLGAYFTPLRSEGRLCRS